jgi:hypothetical protein
MAPVKQLILSGIEFGASARYIADVFRVNGLATAIKIVKDETYCPTFDSSNHYDLLDRMLTKALIKIDFWEDTEAAYNFIKEIRTRSKAILAHPGGCWWVEELSEDDIPQVFDIEEEGVYEVGSQGSEYGVLMYPDNFESDLHRWSPPCCNSDEHNTCEYCVELEDTSDMYVEADASDMV